MPFESTTRRETRLMKELFRDRGRPVFQMLSYCLVEYEGDPDRYIEPLPDGGGRHISTTDQMLNPLTLGLGQIVGFEYFTARPFEVHAFDDANAVDL